MFKYIATFLLASSLYASDMMVWQTPKGLVCTNGSQFGVVDADGMHEVQPCFIDSKLRNRSMACLTAMNKHGYLDIKKLDNNTYKVNFNERGLGGGPILAAVGYWLFKGVVYGTAATAVAGTVVATAGAAGPAIAGVSGTAIGIAGTAAGTTATAVGLAAATGPATAAALTAGGIVTTAASSGALAGATVATVGTVATLGGPVATVGIVESAALWIWAGLMAVPGI